MTMKYVAAGYANDAERLMLDFIKESSTEFSVFADKWRAHNFNAIYLGRQNCELQQFTQEIFQLTLNYLKSTAFYRRIGTIYLLYALFRNQLLDPPVRIRIVSKEFKIIQEFQDIAEENGYKTLYYVIDFLIKNAFDFVAKGILFGPKSAKYQKERESETEFLLNDFKGELSKIIDNDILKELTDLNHLYSEIKQKFQDPKWSECLDFQSRMQALHDLLKDENSQNMQHTSDVEIIAIEPENIGARRAKLKAASFSKRALFRQLNTSDPDGEEESERRISLNVPKRRRKKRIPKEGRKRGRPCKSKVLEDLFKECSADESKPAAAKSTYVKKPGPISRTGYLEYYDDSAIRNVKYVSSESSMSDSSSEAEVDDLVF